MSASGTARGSGALPDLRGRVAIVTGGSRGIGFAAARALLQSGSAVAIVSRDAGELDAAARRLSADGRTIGIAGSVADRAFCFDVVGRVEKELGSVHILVNAAGIQGPIGALHTLDADSVRDTVAINLLGAVWMMQAALPRMMQHRSGVILNLSGGGATKPRVRFGAYAASKIALVRVSEIAAHEYADSGIRVNAVSPGAVNTRMTDEIERAGDDAGSEALEEVRAQRRSGGVDPGVAAELIAWLSSDQARHISGRLISAVWDDWRALIQRQDPPAPDALTLRRL